MSGNHRRHSTVADCKDSLVSALSCSAALPSAVRHVGGVL